ncbi:NAD(P)H-binding protein [Rhizobium sp. YIM 134829]|uniref:NAD(P)H-binding protein n=1 Tax=Rhizobium sp. YIM 134829 TaxID=3390453 RepID=UPI00397990BF
MFIVTGASGKLGRKIISNLLLHVPATSIGASVRDPSKVADIEARGVRVRQGDFSDAESLRDAWAGARRLLLISSNAAATGGDPLEQHATAIRVAREIGVERIFYTSQISSAASSQFPPGRCHAETEEMLARSGLAWTAMRHGFYAESALMMNRRGLDAGSLEAPEDGPVAWVTHDDLAAADAASLIGREDIDGPTPPLTGSETLDLAGLAELAGELLGRPVSRTIVSEETVKTRAYAAGAHDGTIAVMLGYYRAARAGEFAATDPALARILGRAPQTMREFLKAEL